MGLVKLAGPLRERTEVRYCQEAVSMPRRGVEIRGFQGARYEVDTGQGRKYGLMHKGWWDRQPHIYPGLSSASPISTLTTLSHHTTSLQTCSSPSRRSHSRRLAFLPSESKQIQGSQHTFVPPSPKSKTIRGQYRSESNTSTSS